MDKYALYNPRKALVPTLSKEATLLMLLFDGLWFRLCIRCMSVELLVNQSVGQLRNSFIYRISEKIPPTYYTTNINLYLFRLNALSELAL